MYDKNSYNRFSSHFEKEQIPAYDWKFQPRDCHNQILYLPKTDTTIHPYDEAHQFSNVFDSIQIDNYQYSAGYEATEYDESVGYSFHDESEMLNDHMEYIQKHSKERETESPQSHWQ